jgi:hypothetical protein
MFRKGKGFAGGSLLPNENLPRSVESGVDYFD